MEYLLFLPSENVSCWPYSDPSKWKENTVELEEKSVFFFSSFQLTHRLQWVHRCWGKGSPRSGSARTLLQHPGCLWTTLAAWFRVEPHAHSGDRLVQTVLRCGSLAMSLELPEAESGALQSVRWHMALRGTVPLGPRSHCSALFWCLVSFHSRWTLWGASSRPADTKRGSG